MERIVVVGASAAGLGVAEALRREGYDGNVVLVGDELHLPYDRPPLSKQLLKGEWSPDRARLRDPEALDEARLELILGSSAVRLDTASACVELADGRKVPYDGLAIATGVRPKPLPAPHDPRDVCTIRTLDDSIALGDSLRRSRSVVVVGAGFLGIETAAVAREMGLEVHVVDVLPEPMVNQLGSMLARRVARLHVEHGTHLHLGVGVGSVERTARGRRVTLSDGRVLDTDIVVVAVGSTPNVEWLAGSGLLLDNGVVCDQYCIAGDGIVAAGDVARWYHPGLGRHTRVEHRMNATEQSRAAARSLLGHREPFAPVSYFWTDQYDVKIQAYGEVGADCDVEVVEGHIEDDRFAALYYRDDITVGALTWNLPRAARILRQQVVDRVRRHAPTLA